MEKELLDKMLKMLELNQRKKGILDTMASIELEKGIDNEDYHSFISLYKRVYNELNDMIEMLDDKEKILIRNNITTSNKEINRPIIFSDAAIKKDDKYLEYRRILTDLGSKFLIIYNDSINDIAKNQILNALAIYGIELDLEEENVIDGEQVNNYMCSDFDNVLYTETIKLLEKNYITSIQKKELIRIKYNLLFLSPNLEKRALETSFYISSIPKLASVDLIYESGIRYTDYLSYLDAIMSDLLEKRIKTQMLFSKVYGTSIALGDLIILKAYASILNDPELLDCITVGDNTLYNLGYANTRCIIENALKDSKSNAKNNAKIRKYGLIEREIL